MEFLDPKAKRRHRLQLVIGYGLMGALITIITIILVFQAYGFDVNRKTGEVIQNGLIFVDSAPDQASIFFNNQEQKNRTNNRFALPSGDYNLRIHKNGYRDWTRSFTLNGGEVERFTYPLLIPSELKTTQLQATDKAPVFASESPDRRWMIISQGSSITNFTEYDLNSVTKTNNLPDARNFAVPGTIFTPPADANTQKVELVEWSNDNKHFLVKHSYDGKSEFIVISRDQPNNSININSLLGVTPSKVTLRDKKFDQWHIYTEAGGVLQFADAKKNITNLLTNVSSYKSHGDDTLLYAQPNTDGKTQRVSLIQGNSTYTIKDVPQGVVMLDIARYDGSWYLLVAVDAEHKTYIYRDPQATLDKKDKTPLVPRSVLKATGPITNISFSQTTRFMAQQNGQHFEVYDAEQNQLFKYDVAEPFDPGTEVVWMDGHRWLARSGGKALIIDFDNSNHQFLVGSHAVAPVMFDRDYTVIYSLNPIENKTGLYTTDLRISADK